MIFFLLPAPIQRKFYNLRGAGDRTTVRHRLVSESTTDWLQVSFNAVLSLTVLLCLSWLLDSILCSDKWGEALCGLHGFEIIGASKYVFDTCAANTFRCERDDFRICIFYQQGSLWRRSGLKIFFERRSWALKKGSCSILSVFNVEPSVISKLNRCHHDQPFV